MASRRDCPHGFRGLPGERHTGRQSGPRENSLAPARARILVARPPALHHECAQIDRTALGPISPGTTRNRVSGAAKSPRNRHNTGPVSYGIRAGAGEFREERWRWPRPSAGISASTKTTGGASKPSPKRATRAPTSSSSSSPSRPSTAANGPGPKRRLLRGHVGHHTIYCVAIWYNL